MSLHTDRSFTIARQRGAFAARTRDCWNDLMSLSKRELAEIAMRLGALAEGNADSAADGYRRVCAERAALRSNGII